MGNEFVIAVDVGSPKSTIKNPEGKLGWYNSLSVGGFADRFFEQIADKTYYAIGIEAPLFIPITLFTNFTDKRDFEGNRPWSAGPGACVTAIHLPFLALCLQTIKSKEVEITTDYDYWKKQCSNCILFWEAFISGTSKENDNLVSENKHQKDAELACKRFQNENDRQIISLSEKSWINLPQVFASANGIKISHIEKGLIVKAGKQ